MLTYPALCTNYYKAITFFVDSRGCKVGNARLSLSFRISIARLQFTSVFLLSKQLRMVPDELISSMLKSIEIGLFQFGAEVQQVCFEFLQAFGTFIHLEQSDTSFAYQSTIQFIGIVVEMVREIELCA